MALGSMPNEEQLRTIAAATRDEQAQVWKKHKPKKGEPEVAWYEVARALAKRRMPASRRQVRRRPGESVRHRLGGRPVRPARRGQPLHHQRRGVLRRPAGVAAEQPAETRHAAAGERVRPAGQLPKKAERVYGKPGKSDLIGHYLDERTGEVETIAYRLPEPKKAAPRRAARPSECDARRRRR